MRVSTLCIVSQAALCPEKRIGFKDEKSCIHVSGLFTEQDLAAIARGNRRIPKGFRYSATRAAAAALGSGRRDFVRVRSGSWRVPQRVWTFFSTSCALSLH